MDFTSWTSIAQNLGKLVIVLGVGNGDILRFLMRDPLFKTKEVLALALPGDEPGDVEPLVQRVNSWPDVEQWAFTQFGEPADIPRLAGCDVLAEHPLSDTASAFRAQHLARFKALMADRPQALGNDIVDTFMGLYHAALNAEHILAAPSIGQLAGLYGQTPVITIAAGPSVKRHLPRLRELQDRCILVACDAVYHALLDEGIVPHIVTPLERLRQNAPMVQRGAGTRTVFCGLPVCHPDTVGPFIGRTVYLHCGDKLYDWLAPGEVLRSSTGSSTGVLSFLIAAAIARGPVYLVGHDLARDEAATHWDKCELAVSDFKRITQTNVLGATGYEERLVPGNGGGEVRSTTWWDIFRSEIGVSAAAAPGRIFNVNAHDGLYAAIPNTLPAPLPEPSSLPDFGDLCLPPGSPERLADFRQRTKLMEQDLDGFIRHFRALGSDLADAMCQPASSWQLDPLFARLTTSGGVSPGNAMAFEYIFRSAFFNDQAFAHQRCRSARSREHAMWMTLTSMASLCDTLPRIAEEIRPCVQDISRG